MSAEIFYLDEDEQNDFFPEQNNKKYFIHLVNIFSTKLCKWQGNIYLNKVKISHEIKSVLIESSQLKILVQNNSACGAAFAFIN